MYIDLTLSIDIQDPIIAKASADPDSYMSRGHIGTHLDVYGGQAFPPARYCMRRGLLIDAREAEKKSASRSWPDASARPETSSFSTPAISTVTSTAPAPTTRPSRDSRGN